MTVFTMGSIARIAAFCPAPLRSRPGVERAAARRLVARAVSSTIAGGACFAMIVAGAACGGGSGEGAKGPVGTSPGGDPAQSGAPADTAPSAADAGPTSTTTMTLGDGGDLQGAKLASSSSTSMEVKGASGPKPDGHGSEVGRKREDIQALVAAHRDEARKCYDDGLKAHPGIEGDLDVKWVIDPKGAVADISVDDAKSQIHEPSVGGCVIDIIKKIKFAESAKGFETRTHYPFNFHPHGPQPGPKK